MFCDDSRILSQNLCQILLPSKDGRYIRDNFAPQSRQFDSIDELNLQLNQRLIEVANKRPWPDDHNRSVNDVFEEEKVRLLPLQVSFPFYDEIYSVVNKKSMIQFDSNFYSAPLGMSDRLLPLDLPQDISKFIVMKSSS